MQIPRQIVLYESAVLIRRGFNLRRSSLHTVGDVVQHRMRKVRRFRDATHIRIVAHA